MRRTFVSCSGWMVLFVILPLTLSYAATTRDDYKNFITKVYKVYQNDALQHIQQPRQYGATEAKREAFLYESGLGANRDQQVRHAMQLLRAQGKYLESLAPNAPINSEEAIAAAETYLSIRHSQVLSREDHQFVRDLLLQFEAKAPPKSLEYGAMNRSAVYALLRKMILLLSPEAPPSATPAGQDSCGNDRQCYTQRVWNDWVMLTDNIENSTYYNGFWWSLVIKWVRAEAQFQRIDERAFFAQPAVRTLVHRYLAQVSPLGLLPAYGDTTGLNSDPGRWIALMEYWATIYRDGQFKWVAHRLFEWTAPRQPDMDQWGNITMTMMDGLMDAYLVADDSIPERPPGFGSMVTYRRAMEYASPSTPYPILTSTVIPDKLILRSGWNPDDLYALIDLAPFMSHGHMATGAIVLLTSHGSILLADTPYLVKDAQFHNAFIYHPDGFTLPNKQHNNSDAYGAQVLSKVSTTVPVFHTSPLGAFASIRITPYMGHPGTLNRQFIFLHNQLLWVHDTFESERVLQATVGPAWQTVALDSLKGPNWVNTRMPTIPVSAIWDHKYLMQWTNKAWDLLLVFPKAAAGSLIIDDVSRDTTRALIKERDFQNNFNVRIWQQKQVALAPNTPLRFHSVLLPHPPGTNNADRASRVQLLVDSDTQSALAFQDDTGTTWYAGTNAQQALMQVGPFKTDAQAFIVKVKGQTIDESWYTGGTYLTGHTKR